MEMEKAQVEERLNALRQASYGFTGPWTAGGQEAQNLKVRPRQYRAILKRRRSGRPRTNRPPSQAAQSNHGHPPGPIIESPHHHCACEDCSEEPPNVSTNVQGDQAEWRFWQQLRRQSYGGRSAGGQTGNTQMEAQDSHQSPSDTSRPQSPPRQMHDLTIRTRPSSENISARNGQ
ncbi:hypothetical protein B0T21DRAFT_383780 [Apiosordaria backusii]|uniref:Uncharacterized protein n=1 Tax=Apiosordaria backusii TaxID=314023 RepID=A0AA40BKZ0_9PEZI|nr:hypothetical protein B0T21DRAFT_383780 [Apiosordaria backusii]